MNSPDGNGHFTDSYRRWRASRLGRITDHLEHDLLARLLGDVDQRAVLDVGCGDGTLTTCLARQGAHICGLDADPAMLEAARARAEMHSVDIQFVLGRAEALPFADNTFDLLTAVTTLCFIPHAEQATAEMVRVLKPGGRLVIADLGRCSLWAATRRMRGWLGSPIWNAAVFRAPSQLRHLLERHALTITDTRGAIFYPPCALAAAVMRGVDAWLGRHTTHGAAFIALSATKR